jgi:hypothetical protein
MVSSNSLFVLVSGRFVRVKAVRCVVGVFVLFLIVRFSGVWGVPPPMWDESLCVIYCCALRITIVVLVVEVRTGLHREVIGS